MVNKGPPAVPNESSAPQATTQLSIVQLLKTEFVRDGDYVVRRGPGQPRLGPVDEKTSRPVPMRNGQMRLCNKQYQ